MSFQEARFFSFRRPGAFRRCLFLFILVFCFLSCAAAENLLINGSFEETDPDGAPSGWVEDAYVRDEGYTVFSLTEDHSEDGGRQAASIRNIGPNDARYAQKAAVRDIADTWGYLFYPCTGNYLTPPAPVTKP